jgi:hypothetical protein
MLKDKEKDRSCRRGGEAAAVRLRTLLRAAERDYTVFDALRKRILCANLNIYRGSRFCKPWYYTGNDVGQCIYRITVTWQFCGGQSPERSGIGNSRASRAVVRSFSRGPALVGLPLPPRELRSRLEADSLLPPPPRCSSGLAARRSPIETPRPHPFVPR